MLKAKDIVNTLSLDDKIELLTGKNFWYLKAIPKANLASIMLTDGPHGLRKQKDSGDHLGISNSEKATCFPTASALASTWNKALLNQVGQALAKECLTQEVSVLLGPGVNIKRNPLCGRNFEYFSEDPYLSGVLASEMIKGLQSLGIGTSLKHFAVNNQETMRMVVDVLVDERSLRELYLKPFEIAIKASKPWTVMSAYNLINGVYASENKQLLQDILRNEWNYKGIVVTDWGANNNRVKGLIAGQDLDMPSSKNLYKKQIKKALKNKTISIELLEKSVTRNLDLIIKANQTLNKKHQPIAEDKHHQFAREVACESIVLLKNADKLLPLNKNQKVALIGRFAKEPRYQGSGSSLIQPTKLTNAYDAFKDVLKDKLIYADGYSLASDDINQDIINAAIEVTKKADVVIIMAGLPDIYESEGFDRNHLNLPINQIKLIDEITKINNNTIITLANGSPIVMPWKDSVKAIIEQYLTGQASGEALRDIVFGKVNPSGKLAETFPNNLTELPSTSNFPGKNKQVIYKEGLYVGYKAYDKLAVKPLFEFGYGLSYTKFSYHDFSIKNNYKNHKIIVELKITNIGEVLGKEIVQVYVSKKKSLVYRPIQELKAFKKLELNPSETKTISLDIDYKSLTIYQDDFKLEPGEYEIRVGASSRDILYKEIINIKSNDIVKDDLLEVYKNYNKDTVIKDSDYEKLLAKKIAEPKPIKPYNINSTLGEIKQTFIGNKLYNMVSKQMASTVETETNKTNKIMIEKTINQMPLRSLVVFSEGKLSLKRVYGIIDLMNKHIFSGLFKVITG
ncbi:MAG: glycoside hydrolase family 3 C-terminal domain-containing protein [Candidatus Izemoplasmatales bacterium]